MAEKSQIRVEFRPEGTRDVVNALRDVRREAEVAAAGVAQSFSKGGFVNIFDKPKRDASEFVRTIAGLTGSVGAQLSKGTQTPGFDGDFVNLFARAKPAENAMAGLNSALASVIATARQVVPILGVAGAVGAVLTLGRGALQTASDVSKLQQQFRLTAEEITTLRFAARTNEATNEDIVRGLSGLSKSQRELRAGIEDTVNAYADLNLTARDFQGLNLAQSFELIGKRIQGIDPTKLDLDAIFGRGARVLIPLLNEIAEKGLKGIQREGSKVGAILSNDTTAGIKKTADEAQLLGEAVDGLGNSFISLFGPVLRRAANVGTSIFKTIRSAFDADVGGVLQGVGQFIGLDIFKSKKPAAAKPPAGGASDAEEQRKIIEATRRQADEQFKSLSEQNRKRRELAEQAIESERRVVEARVAGSRNQIDASRQLAEAEAQALRARVQLATDTARTETQIAKARYDAELQLARQASQTEAGFAQRRIEVDRRFAQERTRINQAYYADLQRLEAAALAQVTAAREKQKSLDTEIRDLRQRSADQDLEGRIASSGPGSQATERRDAAEARFAQLKKEIAAGDVEAARKSEAAIQSQVSAIRGLDTALRDIGEEVRKKAEDALRGLLEQQKQIAVKNEQDGLKVVETLKAQIASVQGLITEVSATPIPIRLGLADSELQRVYQSIQQALSRPFEITVVPRVQGGGGQGFATGGLIPGMAPHPRADNVLARVTPGEFVQSVAAVQHYGTGFMRLINSRQFPRFADGGPVGDTSAPATLGNGDVVEHIFNLRGRKVRGIFAARDDADRLVKMFEELS